MPNLSTHGGLGVLDGLEDPLAGGDIGRAYFSENQAGVERARDRAFRWASSSASFRMTVGSQFPWVHCRDMLRVDLPDKIADLIANLRIRLPDVELRLCDANAKDLRARNLTGISRSRSTPAGRETRPAHSFDSSVS